MIVYETLTLITYNRFYSIQYIHLQHHPWRRKLEQDDKKPHSCVSPFIIYATLVQAYNSLLREFRSKDSLSYFFPKSNYFTKILIDH